MPQVDLSTLSGPELRRLLDSARNHSQADVAYRILQEMAQRRQAEASPRAPRRRSEPHLVDLNFGDPLDPRPDPAGLEAVDLGPPLTLATPEPFRAAEPEVDAEPEEPLEIRWSEPKSHPGPPPKRIKTVGFATGIGLGAVGGIVVGLAMAEVTFQPQAQAAAPPLATLLSPPAPPVKTLTVAVAPTPPPAVPVAEEPTPAEPTEAAEAPPTTEVAEAEETSPPAEEKPAPEPVKPVLASARCAAIATPADRAICEDPDLQRLQKELRAAYANALEMHEDRGLLRQHQLEWRDARNDVSDPNQLARLYQQRIRKLDAAAQEAARMRR